MEDFKSVEEITVACSSIINQPLMVGYWSFQDGYLKIYLPKKPNWLIRFCSKYCFGLTWFDLEEME